jgi:hypothetical protein
MKKKRRCLFSMPTVVPYRARKKVKDYKTKAYSRTVYQVWISGELFHEHLNSHQWSEYRNIKFLRHLFRREFALNPFEIFKVIKAQLPDTEEEKQEYTKF